MSRARYTTLAYTPGLSSLDRTRVAADVSADIQELRQRLRSEISTQSELKHEIKDLQRELANRVDDLSAKDRELSQQHIALQKLKQQYTKIQVDFEHLEREKENLASENKWLKAEISAAAETHRSLENERLELRAKIVSTEGTKRGAESEQTQLRLEIAQLRNELVRQMEKAVASSKEAEELSSKLHRVTREAQLAEEAHARYFKTSREKPSHDADPDPPAAAAHVAVATPKVEAVVMEELARTKEQLEDLQDENETLRGEVKRLQQELRSLTSLSLRTDEVRKKFRESERALQQKAEAFEKEAHQLSLDKRQLQQQVRDAQRSVDAATRDSLRYHEETQRIRQLLDKSTETIRKEADIKRKMQEEIAALKAKLGEAESEHTRIIRERARSHNTLEVEAKEHQELENVHRERSEKLTREVAQLQAQIHALQRDEAVKTRELEHHVADAQTHKASLRAVEDQLEQTKNDLRKDTEARRKLDEELRDLSGQMQRLQDDKAMMMRELEVRRAEVETRQREVSRLGDENLKLKNEIQQLKRTNDNVSREASNAALHQANESRLHEELKQSREEKHKLEDSILKLQHEQRLWEQEKNRLERALQEQKEATAAEAKKLSEASAAAQKETQAYRSVQDMNAKMLKEITEAGANLRAALDEKRHQENQINHLKKELEALKAAAAAKPADAAAVKSSDAADTAAFVEAQKEIASLKQKVSDLQVQLAKETKAKEESALLLKRIQKAKAAGAAPAADQAPTASPTASPEIEKMKKELEELQKERALADDLKAQIELLTKDKTKAEELKKEVEALAHHKAKAEQLQKELEALALHKQRDADALKQQQSKAEQLQKEIDALAEHKGSADGLKKEIAALLKEKARAEELAKKVEQLQKEKEELAAKALTATPQEQLAKELEQLKAEKARAAELEEANADLKRQASEWRSKFQLVRTISSDGKKRPMLKRDGSGDMPIRRVVVSTTPPDAQTARIIKLQAVARGFMCRLDYKDAKYRRNIALEIYETERAYVGTLDALVRTYVAPLRHMISIGEQIISNDDISFVFSNVDLLYAGNKKMLDQLDQRVKKWHSEQVLADVFLTAIKESWLQPHVPFIQNFTKSSEARARLINSVPLFSTFVKLCRGMPGVEGKSLDDLLITPVQRLPRYKLLLTDLLKRTSRSHPDYMNVTRAIAEIDSFTSFINENNRRADEMNILSSRLSGLEQLEPNPERRLLFEGKLGQISGKEQKRRYLLLFSDCLVFAKSSGRKRLSLTKDAASKAELKVIASIKLTSKTIAEVIPALEGKPSNVTFGVTFGEGQQNIFIASSEEERNKWVDAITSTIPRPMMRSKSKGKKLNKKNRDSQ